MAIQTIPAARRRVLLYKMMSEESLVRSISCFMKTIDKRYDKKTTMVEEWFAAKRFVCKVMKAPHEIDSYIAALRTPDHTFKNEDYCMLLYATAITQYLSVIFNSEIYHSLRCAITEYLDHEDRNIVELIETVKHDIKRGNIVQDYDYINNVAIDTNQPENVDIADVAVIDELLNIIETPRHNEAVNHDETEEPKQQAEAPEQEAQTENETNDTDTLKNELRPYFINNGSQTEELLDDFVGRITGSRTKSKIIHEVIKKFQNDHAMMISDVKGLHEILYRHGVYTRTYKNMNTKIHPNP